MPTDVLELGVAEVMVGALWGHAVPSYVSYRLAGYIAMGSEIEKINKKPYIYFAYNCF